jgi:nitronate monooxygenase
MAPFLSTALTRLLPIDFPIMQAPIGSCSGPELCASVSNAGGLGMMGLSWDSPQRCRKKIAEANRLTDRAFGVNLVLEWDQSERLATCLEAGARIVSLFWGNPERYLGRIHASGAKAIVSVGNVEEARQAADLGADVVLCQGWEAGGHVRGEIGTMSLVPAVVDAISPVPVIAAGGMADGRGLAAALALGAAGICMGTRFVATEESLAHANYKERIVQAGPGDTVHTCLFSGGWENAAHRVLRNSTVETWEKSGRASRGSRPGENDVIGHIGDNFVIHRYDDTPPVRNMTGDWEACALYAGQSAGVVKSVVAAGEVVRQVAEEAVRIIRRLNEKTRIG